MEVHILDTVSERGIVHTITDAVHRSELRNVDLSKQKCDCGKYQQTGLPCKDAWFLLKELYPNGMPQDLFSEKYFHKDCFTMRVKNMFADVPELLGTIPSTSEVDNRLRSKSFRTIKAPLANDSKSYRSSKRLTSTGESSSSSTSQASFKKQKKQCPDCHQWLSRKTLHPTSACSRYCIRNGMSPPEVILSGYIDELSYPDDIAELSESPAEETATHFS
mmetsp:Transcript_18494/g.26859  ORF Transcript_18494/g.26859 Transcript_18494/m.26859 type:complete len:219 (+) Transcript_18494:1087-1743(+)